jgi:hypothetical protein
MQTMLLINFNLSPKSAFAQGFMKGLGAPVVLFGRFQASPSVEIQPIIVPSSGLGSDWRKVGDDIRSAARAYGETAGAR